MLTRKLFIGLQSYTYKFANMLDVTTDFVPMGPRPIPKHFHLVSLINSLIIQNTRLQNFSKKGENTLSFNKLMWWRHLWCFRRHLCDEGKNDWLILSKWRNNYDRIISRSMSIQLSSFGLMKSYLLFCYILNCSLLSWLSVITDVAKCD